MSVVLHLMLGSTCDAAVWDYLCCTLQCAFPGCSQLQVHHAASTNHWCKTSSFRRCRSMLHPCQVLAMLFDLEMSAISSKQLGQHAAHHLWQCIMQDLSALPAVEVTLQQVRG